MANYNFALEINDGLAPAHAALALIAYQWAWDWATADREFKRALELDPNSASAYEPSPPSTYHWYSHDLMSVGRTEESIRAGHRAEELDPVDLAIVSHQGSYYLWTRDYCRGIAPLQKTIDMDPNFSVSQWYVGLVYEQQGPSRRRSRSSRMRSGSPLAGRTCSRYSAIAMPRRAGRPKLAPSFSN